MRSKVIIRLNDEGKIHSICGKMKVSDIQSGALKKLFQEMSGDQK